MLNDTPLVLSLRPWRPLLVGGFDAFAWVSSFVVMAAVTHLAGIGEPDNIGRAMVAGGLCAAAHVALALPFRLHQGRAAIGGFEDVVLMSAVAVSVGAVSIAMQFTTGPYYRTVVAVASPLLAILIMLWGRTLARFVRDRSLRLRRQPRPDTEPVVVVGAGEAATQLVRAMFADPRSHWRPVALVDDDPWKRHRKMRGVSVVGRTSDVVAVARERGVSTVVVAIPSATKEFIQSLVDLTRGTNLDLKVLPKADDLLQPGRVGITDIRDIELTDLLGRHQIDTDIDSIAGYLTGKRILVTGAGGSIGSELCRQVARFDPAELIMLDRDESALHAVQLSIYGQAMLDSDDVVLADIRDSLYIDSLFEQRKPEVVFHAAALKHLPMLEQYPGEAIKTNVWGTLSILEAAKAHGVERFVNISTDKAANPCNVLGYSKRLAEGLTAAVAAEADGTYLSVRFGNVLGSRGSVLTAFTAQIAKGGPVTVTHPEVTRFFMTVQEAVQLVIQAAAIGRDGEALVLDMGEPVSIDSVARQLIELSGKDIEIVYTGLRDGEKLHEELWGDGEPDLRPAHPRVSHTPVPAYDPVEARELDPWAEHEQVLKSFRESVVPLRPRGASRFDDQLGRARA
ncbi:MAG TPA: nucleoside-diphosphate sugar epimerase/dehydratase [Marmoricola sp.]|nr:nucleoside-diphosphate sugar epimerase/dehydratase [Marmoricola sp.]